MRQVVSAEMGVGVDGCVDGTYQCGRQTTFLGGQQSCDCGAAGARHPINELRGDRARLALSEEQCSGSRHGLRGDLDALSLDRPCLRPARAKESTIWKYQAGEHEARAWNTGK